MDCSHCSSELSPAASFCPSCGVPVDKPSSALDSKPIPTVEQVQKHTFSRKLVLVFGVSVVFFAAIAYFFLVPRMSLLSSLKNSKHLLAETSDKTEKLNQSLQAVYKYVTASSGGNESPVIDVNVLGENTSSSAPNLYFLKNEIDEAVEGLRNRKVKAFSTPKNDPLKVYRDLRDLAVNASTNAEEGLESVKRLQKSSEKTSSASRAISSELTAVTKESQNYLSEGEKTANYYQNYTDAYVDLTGFIVASLQASNEAQVKENFELANQVRQKMAELPESALPAEIESFHQDVLTEIEAAMSFLSVFNKVIASKDPKGVNQVAEAAKKWVAEEQALLLKMQTDQLNFWKKNPSFANYDFLKTKQNEVVQTLEAESKAQSLFIFN